MNLQLSHIAEVVSGKLLGADVCCAGLSIDSRNLRANQLYVALKGRQFDGHAFIEAAAQAGAAAVMVEQPGNTALPQLQVADTRLALAQIAGEWRRRQAVSVVGVTGSNGKTTVKEMLAAILTTQNSTLFTQGNLNNDIGVPLTLLRLDGSHRFAVVEMGANHPGEIAYSCRFARPDVAIINNVGPAHIEGFGDLAGVARSKGEIVQGLAADGVAILNSDDEFYPLWREMAGPRRISSFGFAENADVSAAEIRSRLTEQGFVTDFELLAAGERQPVTLALAGRHNVRNALAAAAAALALDISLPDIRKGLELVRPVTGRLQPLRGRLGNVVIDDTYNANPASLQAALEILAADAENWVILGAFGELGDDAADMHREMGHLLRSMPVSRLFAVGELARQTVTAFGAGAEYFETQQLLLAALNQVVTGKEILLIKGSRAQKMENVVAALVENFRAA